jgi:polyphenol oxidase
MLLHHFSHLQNFPNLVHFQTTRTGGVSSFPYQSLNLGLNTKDNPENVIKNREILANYVNIPKENFCFAQQVHKNRIITITADEKGKGIYDYADAIPETDGMITQEKDICLMVMGADCPLLVFYDPIRQAIGACHAGWRGTLSEISAETVKQMVYAFDCSPEDILVGIGAGISTEVYEVGEEVLEKLKFLFGKTERFIWKNPMTKKNHLDLVYTNTQLLTDVGVLPQNIQALNLCTHTQENNFFSARRDKITGRCAMGIMLRSS